MGVLSSFNSFSQTLEGVWKGTMYNDSTQITYRYEVAIHWHDGYYSGFSHTRFELNNQQYYGVKKIKVKQDAEGNFLIIDNGLLANNYPEKPAKGVRQTNKLKWSDSSGVFILSGPFSTNPTREYAVLTGYVHLLKTTDYSQSLLIPHLEDLSLAKEISFLKQYSDTTTKTNLKSVKHDIAAGKGPTARNKEKGIDVAVMPLKPVDIVYKPAQFVHKRENVLQQTVDFYGDSLTISLYDNGEVDGDTVSVLMNGKILLPKVGLSTSAVNYVIDTKQLDTIKLVMYAETLGSIPPNTGLLVIRTGKEIHEIRFSGNYSHNAAIVLRKKSVLTLQAL